MNKNSLLLLVILMIVVLMVSSVLGPFIFLGIIAIAIITLLIIYNRRDFFEGAPKASRKK